MDKLAYKYLDFNIWFRWKSQIFEIRFFYGSRSFKHAISMRRQYDVTNLSFYDADQKNSQNSSAFSHYGWNHSREVHERFKVLITLKASEQIENLGFIVLPQKTWVQT